MSIVIGVDVGGTFTDAVAADEQGRIVGNKTPSTPPDYSQGVLVALEGLANELRLSIEEVLSRTAYVSHGTTSSLNALVMGKVAPVGFITTKGHRDSIYIMNVEGRYLGKSSDEIQAIMHHRKPAPLVPRRRAKEVAERIDFQGKVVVPLNEDEARQAIQELLDEDVTAIAVSLLWSFRNPQHEHQIRTLIHEVAPDMYVSLSSELSPRIREFARNSTTIMSTQIGPGLRDYLLPLEKELKSRSLGGPLLVMQSSGGTITAREAPESAITTVGSVLTGGVVGAVHLGKQLGHRNIITTDVGGTTFLAGLIVDGEPLAATTSIINQHTINVPALQVTAIGSGGGAIAWIDPGGNLRIGPQSAQAVPGPACYGQGGGEPTNTDANLVLGILSERGLLGGKKPLSRELAAIALSERVGKPLEMSAEEAAAAIYAVQNAQTADLLRKVVIDAGHDPRDFVVYAFGGAGPAHCAAYSRELGVNEVIVPLGPVASAFSAFGLAAATISVSAEISDPAFFPVTPERMQANFDQLEAQVRQRLQQQNLEFERIELKREVDMRYTMQLAEVPATVPGGQIDEATVHAAGADFEARYAQRYGKGSGFREAGLQVITYRVRGNGILPFSPSLPHIPKANGQKASEAISGSRAVCLDFRAGFVETPIYDYQKLRAGHVIEGPAIVEVPTTTVVIPPETEGRVDQLGNLVIHFN
jgi:N-methylhydantoinase A